MIGLALSGGGARGAFQAGAIRAMCDLGIRPDVGVGVSTGALNITHAMHGQGAELVDVWRSIRERDVHRMYSGMALAWRIGVRRRRGLHDHSPLRATIQRLLPRPHPAAYAGWVDQMTGDYHCTPADVDSIYRSATMPVIWEPVDGQYVDGGVRHVLPLADVIERGATRVIAVLCRPTGLRDRGWRPGGMLPVAADLVRTLDILMDEIAEGDLRETARITADVRAGRAGRDSTGRLYRAVDVTVIRPERWIGDTLSFDAAEISDAIDHGYAVAMQRLTDGGLL